MALAHQHSAVADAQAQVHLANQRVQVWPPTPQALIPSVNHFPQYPHLPGRLTLFDPSQLTQLGVIPLTWASLQASLEHLLSLPHHLPSTWKDKPYEDFSQLSIGAL